MDFFNIKNSERYTDNALKNMGVIKETSFIDYDRLRGLGYYPITYDKPSFDSVFYNISPSTFAKSADGKSYVQGFELVQRNDLDLIKTLLKEKITALRWDKETAGITLNGNKILTGIDDQNRIATICLSAVSSKVKGTTFTPVQFKTASGEWITLDADTLIAIGEVVTAHVEACFANEQRLHTLVDAAATFGELKAIDIESGWSDSNTTATE